MNVGDKDTTTRQGFLRATRKQIALMFRRFNSMGLARKFYLLYVLLLVVPVIVVAVLIARNSTKAAISNAMEQGKIDIQAARVTAEKNIAICWHAVQLVKSNKKFVEVLSTQKPYTTLELVQFQRDVLSNIDAIKNINADLYQFEVYTDNETLYEFYPTIHFESRISNTAWFSDLARASTGMTYLFGKVDGDNAMDVFSLNSELTSPDNEHIGVIRAQMLSDVFFGPLYAGTADDSQFFCIVGSDGSLHYNEKNHMATQYLSGGTAIAKSLINEAVKSGNGFTTKFGNNQVVVNWEYIPALKSYMMEITSMEQVNREIGNMIVSVILGSLLLLGFLSLATYVIVTVLVKKLRTVITLMRRVEHGDLVVDIPDLGHDEVGELSNHFRAMLAKINELIYTVYKKQIATREAEIKSLYSQLNAHFIYNVLESIKMMAVLQFEYEIAESITSLGRIMRYSMNWRKQHVLLREETGNLTSYVRLMNLQREVPVELAFDIPDALYDHEVLKMMLQPLAENAMVHGLKQRKEGGRLEVSAKEQGYDMLISVCDNGSGMTQQRLEEINTVLGQEGEDRKIEGSGNGIGLVNINQRIKLFYGKEYGIAASNGVMEGACITLCLPMPGSAGRAKEM